MIIYHQRRFQRPHVVYSVLELFIAQIVVGSGGVVIPPTPSGGVFFYDMSLMGAL